MSFQFPDFAIAADRFSTADIPQDLERFDLNVRLATLMGELQQVISEIGPFLDDPIERVRAMRVEFGFDPDDEPKAHLSPLVPAPVL